VWSDAVKFMRALKAEDLGFKIAVLYLVFSYLRPQVLLPWLSFVPWTQLVILAGLIYILLYRKLSLQGGHYLVLMFYMIILISAWNSQYPSVSFSKIDIVGIWLLEMVFFTNIIKNIRQYWLLTVVLFVILFKMSLFGAKTWAMRGFGFTKWGIAGPDGFFSNSGEYSLLMAMLAVWSLAFILRHENKSRLYYLLPITAVMSVLGASSRGGQLALIAGLLYLAFVVGRLRIKTLFYIVLSGWLIYQVIPEEQKERFESMGSDNTSVSRVIYWKSGLDMLQKYPLTGVGYNAFPEYFHDHYSFLLEKDDFLSSRKEVSHNTYIQMASNLGYPGIAVYLAMIYLLFRYTRKSLVYARDDAQKEETWMVYNLYGLEAALVTYLIGSTFMSVGYYPYIYLLFMFVMPMYKFNREFVREKIRKSRKIGDVTSTLNNR